MHTAHQGLSDNFISGAKSTDFLIITCVGVCMFFLASKRQFCSGLWWGKSKKVYSTLQRWYIQEYMYRYICIHSSSEQQNVQVNVIQAWLDDLMNSRPKQVDIKSVTRRFWHVMVCETCSHVNASNDEITPTRSACAYTRSWGISVSFCVCLQEKIRLHDN